MNTVYLKYIIILITFCANGVISAQDDPYQIEYLDFINYTDNKFILPDDTGNYERLFDLFNRLVLQGKGQINILHIGDSHIQADYLSGRIRQRLQTFFQGGLGGRGFVFPYNVAKTNNPYNLSVTYSGAWEGCKNTEAIKNCDLGLSGISVTTYDSISSISIALRDTDHPKYDFNRIKIFHNTDSTSYSIKVDNYSVKQTVIDNDTLGYTLFILQDHLDSLNLRFIKTADCQRSFTLHGISLETNDPGIVYHSIGINGAEVESFLRCNLFTRHLKALDPDWIIISLGTNDCYPEEFDKNAFGQKYEQLLQKIYSTDKDVAILLTVPGDSYRHRKFLNTNTGLVQEEIFRVAKKYNCAVWDLYTVMGGLNSIYEWYKNDLTAKDKLHLNKNGYFLQGDLFFNAFLKAYDEYIEKGTGH